ncbi:hypothetical protein AWM70_18065 [Paenibacillus yonginensis]|uniref:Uncharacterized protein n=1 Tax=Paenibacillus yonginensis TaxID=1462996 RepID=A0A1B1N4A3_9BACL|nr:hypothetical protein [Paenibacillus yonginensis]ANS76254.1 hypothetical protein AWM70_18065 [Paenibacillus yonginensis]
MYFERTNNAKIVMIVLGVLFTLLTFIFYGISNFGELIHYGIADRLMRKIDTVVFFIFAVLSFAASIVLHFIMKDAQDELDAMAAQISREIEKAKQAK